MASPTFTLSTTSTTYPDLTATVTNPGNDDATWSSSDTSVATVTAGETSAPTITFVGYGTTTITADWSSGAADTTVNLTFNKKDLTIAAPSIAAKTYDGTTAAGTLTTGALSGVVSGDTVTASGSAGALSDADAGSRTCTVTYTISGDDSGNYNAPADSTNVSCQVNKKNLTIAAPSIAAKTYDGTTTAGTLTEGTLSGVVSNDDVDVDGTAGALSDADAGSRTCTVTYTISGDDSGNYNAPADSTNVSCQVNKKNLTIAAAPSIAAKTYDGTTAAGTLTEGTLSGVVSNDDVDVDGTAGALSDADAGSRTCTVTYTISGDDSGNYNAPADSTNVSCQVNKKNLTIAAPSIAAKTYDGTTAAGTLTEGTLSGVVSNDDVTVDGTAGALSDADAGSRTCTVTYTISGDDSGNYNAPADSTNVSCQVNKKNLTIAAPSIAAKTYDGTTAAGTLTEGTLSGVVSNDDVDVDGTAGALSDADAGSRTCTVTYTISGDDSGNYNAPADSTNVSCQVNKKNLTIAAPSIAAKTYDGTTAAGTLTEGTLSGVVSNDDVTVDGTAGALSDADAGSRTCTVTYTISGDDSGNYNAPADSTNVSCQVNKKNLTIAAPSIAAKTYDGTTTAGTLTEGTLSGVVSNDDVDVDGTAGALSDADAGSRTCTVTYTISGDDSGNYNAPADSTNVSCQVNKKNLTIAAPSIAAKTYDGTTAAGTLTEGTLSGVVSNDDVTVDGTAGALSDADAGSRTCTVTYTISGDDSGNYNAPADSTNVSCQVNKKNLTIAAPSIAAKTYDGTTTAGTLTEGTLSGVVSNDDVDVDGTAGALSDADAGSRTCTVTYTISGDDSGNYNAPADSTNVTCQVNKKALTVSGITASNKQYDGTTSATVSVENAAFAGIVTGDTVTVTATGTFADKAVADGKTVNLSETMGGADVGNYTVTAQGTTTANITKKQVTVSGITASNKNYDGNDSATVNGGVVNDLVAGEQVTVSATGTFVNKNAGQGKTVNLVETLGGAHLGNYEVTKQETTTATIHQIPLTISGITASNKVYDQTTPATVSVTGAVFTGKLTDDDVSVTATGVFGDKTVGVDKEVTLTESVAGTDAGNYTITKQGTTTATITKKALTVSGIAVDDKVYDQTTAATVSVANASFEGLINGDTVTVTATGSFPDKHAEANKVIELNETMGAPTLGTTK